MTPLQLMIERRGAPPTARSFDADSVIAGRSDTADIIIDDYSVSRRHARFFRERGAWFVEDLGSRNGTDLNGSRISEPSPVNPGDVITIGSTLLRLPGDASVSLHSTTEADRDESIYSVLCPAADLMEDVTTGGDAKAMARLRLLHEVHRTLAAPIARADLLQMLLDHACAVLRPEQAAIFMRAADGSVERVASRQWGGSTSPLLVSRRLAEEVIDKRSAALVLDAQCDERFADAMSVVASGVRSILAAPLADAEGCLGMIALYSSIGVRRFSEQDLEVLVSIASAAAMRIRNIAMAEAAAERRALDREIALARDIQMALLRRRPPERPEVELAGRVIPAHSVGGDFYDFLTAGEKLWFVVADVSGKGMGAALMMAVGQTLFRAVTASGRDLGEVMARVNHELAVENDRAMFITAMAGCLDLATGLLLLVNAGHNLPYHVGRDGVVSMLNVRNSLALGVVEDAAYPVTEVFLAPGDAVLLYTDGVCDAIDEAGHRFGASGLERALGQIGSLPADAVVQHLCDSVTGFAGNAPQEDDITVALVRYRGTGV
jgi:serine phosphatase RsbU (regulator of sigma subunit)/pSer/pThr/pTyr-binding forkhead associated (FHA) protein